MCTELTVKKLQLVIQYNSPTGKKKSNDAPERFRIALSGQLKKAISRISAKCICNIKIVSEKTIQDIYVQCNKRFI
jgi:hypothetical protein